MLDQALTLGALEECPTALRALVRRAYTQHRRLLGESDDLPPLLLHLFLAPQATTYLFVASFLIIRGIYFPVVTLFFLLPDMAPSDLFSSSLVYTVSLAAPPHIASISRSLHLQLSGSMQAVRGYPSPVGGGAASRRAAPRTMLYHHHLAWLHAVADYVGQGGAAAPRPVEIRSCTETRITSRCPTVGARGRASPLRRRQEPL